MSNFLEVLSSGEIEVQGRLVDASNATLFVTVSTESANLSAIYKPLSGERPLWDFTEGTLGLRERAAYLVSELGGFHLVPITIWREGPFGFGSVQMWIDIDEGIDMATYYRQRSPQLRSAALFDAIVNNTDRKIGHLLPTSDGALYLCDHGVTFHEEDKLRTVLWQWAGEELSQEERDQIQSLITSFDSKDAQELSSLLSSVEIAALKIRCSRLLTEGTFPVPNPEWPAIPWPPF
jgi:hypothetical protein